MKNHSSMGTSAQNQPTPSLVFKHFVADVHLNNINVAVYTTKENPDTRILIVEHIPTGEALSGRLVLTAKDYSEVLDTWTYCGTLAFCDTIVHQNATSYVFEQCLRERIAELDGLASDSEPEIEQTTPDSLAISSLYRVMFDCIGAQITDDETVINGGMTYAVSVQAAVLIESLNTIDDQIIAIDYKGGIVVVTLGEAASLGACEVVTRRYKAASIPSESDAEILKQYPCLTAEQVKARAAKAAKNQQA